MNKKYSDKSATGRGLLKSITPIMLGICLLIGSGSQLQAKTNLQDTLTQITSLNGLIIDSLGSKSRMKPGALQSDEISKLSQSSHDRLESRLTARRVLMLKLAKEAPDEFMRNKLAAEYVNHLPGELKHLSEQSFADEGYIAEIMITYNDGRQAQEFYLHDTAALVSDAPTRLYLTKPPSTLKTGSRVRVRGRGFRNKEMVIATDTKNVATQSTTFSGSNDYSDTSFLQVLSVPVVANAVTGPTRVAIVLVNMIDSTVTVTPAGIEALMFGNQAFSVASHFADGSYGTATLTGNYYATVNTSRYKNEGLSAGTLVNDAIAQLGLDDAPAGYDRVAFIIAPGTTGSWFAYAYMNWYRSVYNNLGAGFMPYPDAFSHEFGHNDGLGHAGWRMPDSSVEAYGDMSGVMGYGRNILRGYNAPHKISLGWIPASRIQDVTTSGTYTVNTADKSSFGPQVLRIGGSEWDPTYVSYRSSVGYGNYLYDNYKNKTSIHTGGLTSTILEANLGDGQSRNIAGVTFTQLSHNNNSATISISMDGGGGGPTKYALTVNNGSGSGSYDAGSDINISANTAPSGKSFDRWIVNTNNASLTNEYAPSTVLTMPASAVRVTASYKNVAPTGVVITASGENGPNETKEKAFDGNRNTKWLTFADSGWIQYDFAGNTAKTIKGYNITSANDAPERDPRDWRLLGSNGSGWTTLDIRSGEVFSNRFQKRSFSFINSTSYKIYRLDINSNFNPPSANSTQLAELELIESVVLPSNTVTVNNGIGDGTYQFGSTVTITADIPPSGQMFDRWTGDSYLLVDANAVSTTLTMPTGSVIVTATYKNTPGPSYSLVVNNGNGDGSYQAGTVVTITANNPPSGQMFDKWVGGVGLITNINAATTTLNMPAGELVVTATYKNQPAVYSLVVNNGNGDGSYQAGTVVTITANNPPSGQMFDRWAGDIGLIDNAAEPSTRLTMPNSMATVTATYKNLPTYTLTVNNGNGDGDYQASTVVTISASTAPSGQKFDKWAGDVGLIANVAAANTTLTMPTGAATVTATYKDLPISRYRLIVGNGVGNGNVNGGVSYPVGSIVTIVANNAHDPTEEFDQWLLYTGLYGERGDINDIANPMSSTTTVTMPANILDIIAVYKKREDNTGNITGKVLFHLGTDRYGSETSWDLKNSNGSIIDSHSSYNNLAYNIRTFDLPDGNYTFTIRDSYGDGIFCDRVVWYAACGYSLISEEGGVIATGGDFGSSESVTFTIGNGGSGPVNPPEPSELTINDLKGTYIRQPASNNWHRGVIEVSGQYVQWKNYAGVSWELVPQLAQLKLLTTSASPYYNYNNGDAFKLIIKTKPDGSKVIDGFKFLNEKYTKQN